jgi:uncharacterized membrane protein YbhN (UPF0104 family)
VAGESVDIRSRPPAERRPDHADAEGARGRRRVVALLKIAVSAGLLAYLLSRVDASRTLASMESAAPAPLVAAFGMYLAGQVASAVKWRMLAAAVGFTDPPLVFVANYFVGMFFNVFGLGTVGGDVVRALYLAGAGGRRTVALNTVLADRLSGLFVLLAIALVSLLLFRSYELPAGLYWTTLSFSALLLAGWRAAPWVVSRWFRESSRVRRLVEHDLAPYWNDLTLLARVAGVSLVFHCSQIATQMLIARALGLEVPLSYFFIFVPLVNLASSLPVSLNGIGVREGGTVFFLTHVGVAEEAAIAFALVWLGILIAAGLVGGIVYLSRRRAGDAS